MAVYENGELVLYGVVGDSYWDEGFTAREVLAALAEHGAENPLPVRLNSGGGYVDDGRSIYNALKLHEGEVTIYVDAVAASSASLIAMAGDKIIMRSGAIMMIHDSRETGSVVVPNGETYLANTVLGQVTADKTFVKYDPTASDGSETVAAILIYPATGTSDMSLLKRHAQVKAAEHVWFDAADDAQKATGHAELESLGIIVR